MIDKDEAALATVRRNGVERFCLNFGFRVPGQGVRALDQAWRTLEAASLFDLSGGVLLSSEATLRKGNIYFLGVNPGGDVDDAGDYPTIAESLFLSRVGYSAFD